MPRGGKRKGAGRPLSTPGVPLSEIRGGVTLSRSTNAWVGLALYRLSITWPEYVRRLIDADMKSD